MTNKRVSWAQELYNFKGRFLAARFVYVCIKKISLLDQKSKPTTIIKHCARLHRVFTAFLITMRRVVSVLTRPPSIAFLASDYYFFEKRLDWLPARQHFTHTLYLSANIRLCAIIHISQPSSRAAAREWDMSTFICRCTLGIRTHIHI